MPYLSYIAGLIDFKAYFGVRNLRGKYKIYTLKISVSDLKIAKKLLRLFKQNDIQAKLFKEGNVYSVSISDKKELLKLIKKVKRYVIFRKRELEKFENKIKKELFR